MAYIKHTVSYGDTLQELAQRYLDDSERWVEIAVLNNLDYPFIVDELRTPSTPPNVKAIGEELIIPVEQSFDTLPIYEKLEDYDKILGEDLALFSDEKVIGVSEGYEAELQADVNGDLKTVRGIQNLKQAIILRLLTPQGSLLHHPQYGSKLADLVGQKGSPGQLQKIRIEILRTVRSDSRVKDAVIDELTLNGDILTVSMRIFVVGLDDVIDLVISMNGMGVIEWA